MFDRLTDEQLAKWSKRDWDELQQTISGKDISALIQEVRRLRDMNKTPEQEKK